MTTDHGTLTIRRSPGLPSMTFIGVDWTDAERIRSAVREAMGSAYPLDRITVDARDWPSESALVAAIVDELTPPTS